METWFHTAKIDDTTWKISEPKHWEQPNCYVLSGNRYALLIDSGLGIEDISIPVRACTSLPLCVIATHVHWDHIGGYKHFLYHGVQEAEKSWLKQFPLPASLVLQQLTQKPCEFPDDFNINAYQLYQQGAQYILQDGDVLDLGGRRIQVFHTPGHSPGHMCFYDEAKQYLFTGDLLYHGCLDAYYDTTDPLAFYQSLKRIMELPVQRYFGAHYQEIVTPTYAQEVMTFLEELKDEGQLHHGSGIHQKNDVCFHF